MSWLWIGIVTVSACVWQAQILNQKSCYQKVSVFLVGMCSHLYYLSHTFLCQIVARLNITLYVVILLPAHSWQTLNYRLTVISKSDYKGRVYRGQWQRGLVRFLLEACVTGIKIESFFLVMFLLFVLSLYLKEWPAL